MPKLISATLVVIAFMVTSIHSPRATQAGTCASKCGSSPVQFTPGQYIRLEVINNTNKLVKIQGHPTSVFRNISPGQTLRLDEGFGTEPNMSVIFWDDSGLPLRATISKPNFGTLRLVITNGKTLPGDRSIYILDSGRVNVL
ncbi:MAG: hypothetical protein KME64_02510 [Scytonematopsis contorta HA4267-MV1]|nr:hypothetical protein [Scytonematopsis contorta HA4267-MV1]